MLLSPPQLAAILAVRIWQKKTLGMILFPPQPLLFLVLFTLLAGDPRQHLQLKLLTPEQTEAPGLPVPRSVPCHSVGTQGGNVLNVPTNGSCISFLSSRSGHTSPPPHQVESTSNKGSPLGQPGQHKNSSPYPRATPRTRGGFILQVATQNMGERNIPQRMSA